MQYDAKTPAQYMNMLEDDWRREKVQQLRRIIKSTAPELKEGINYKMLCYADDRGILFHLNAQKGYVSLYVGNAEKIDPDGSLLEGIDVGKGCVRFKKSVSIPESRIEEFLQRAVRLWKQGKDLGC